MATSDIFTKKDPGVRSRYLVSGAGGILFTLPLGVFV